MDIHVAADLLLARLVAAAPNDPVGLAIWNSKAALLPVIEKFLSDNLDGMLEFAQLHRLSCSCPACDDWRTKLAKRTARPGRWI